MLNHDIIDNIERDFKDGGIHLVLPRSRRRTTRTNALKEKVRAHQVSISRDNHA